MLRRFHIENFKSLTDFTIEDMGQFLCLIGLNGSGKTSLMQAIDFMAHLASGSIDDWLGERDWTRSDLTSKLYNKRQLINFRLTFDFERTITWDGAYNASLGRCTREEIRIEGEEEPTFNLLEGEISLLNGRGKIQKFDISQFQYTGSFFSILKLPPDPDDPRSQVIQFMESIKSLELLAPHRMRIKARPSDDVGTGGEKLSGYLHGLSYSQKRDLLGELREFYPQLRNLGTRAKRAGWAQIHTTERYESEENKSPVSVETEAKHLNDGLLRILVIIAQTKTQHRFLLFDEIENGINPEKIGQLMKYLLNAAQQILVTTHNPLILNFLPDEKAKESVFFLYRNRYGATKAVKFFELPEIVEKLDVLGPGEAFLDTSLEELSSCIEAREAANV